LSRARLAALLTLSALLHYCTAAERAAHVSPTDGDDVAVLTRDKQGALRFTKELAQAWKLYERAQMHEAREAFTKVASAEGAPEPDRVQALFGLGLSCAFGRPSPRREEAQRAFEQIVTQYPHNPAAPWALIELGNLVNRKEPGGGESSRPFYERVLRDYAHSPAIHEAVLRLANTYFYELDPPLADRALELLESHLKLHPDNPLAEVMLFRLGYWYAEVRQDYDRSIVFAEELGRRRMSDPFRWSRQNWHIAETYRMKLGRPAKAVPWYLKIIRETPRSYHTLAAKRRLEELGVDWREKLGSSVRTGGQK